MFNDKTPLSYLALIWSRSAVSGIRTVRLTYWLLRSILWYLQSRPASHNFAQLLEGQLPTHKPGQVALIQWVIYSWYTACNGATTPMRPAHWYRCSTNHSTGWFSSQTRISLYLSMRVVCTAERICNKAGDAGYQVIHMLKIRLSAIMLSNGCNHGQQALPGVPGLLCRSARCFYEALAHLCHAKFSSDTSSFCVPFLVCCCYPASELKVRLFGCQ